jgi:ribA/ribD-fused uncharacterized protein
MYRKALLFEDYAIADKILKEKFPKNIKALGRRISNFDEDVWSTNKIEIVTNGTYLKFSQNKDILRKLMATGDKILVEASPYDRIWGIGLSARHKDAKNPSKWKGQNLLGKILMDVRDQLNANF